MKHAAIAEYLIRDVPSRAAWISMTDKVVVLVDHPEERGDVVRVDIAAWVETAIGRGVVVKLDLLHEVGVQCSNCTDQLENKSLDTSGLLVLDKVTDVLKKLRVKEVGLNNEAGVLYN